ncbi:FadR/GntR family transcriptional regulator [Brachybacterium sp. NPDC056505]|uniref:FadR/GntR family transcriptional regulator n=1 Tax=Brachybacterium sp. NPDC056505 TaxID=3345843 RepID=UPI00366F236E
MSTSAMHEGVLDDLGRRIADGRLPEGAVLTLSGIEKDCSASRTVAREAVRVLETLGMVASRRRVGITVQPRGSWDAFSPRLIDWNLAGPFRQRQLEALAELRVAAEPMAAHLAARRADSRQCAELRRLAEELVDLGDRGLGDSEEYLEADVAFHDLLLAASGNPQLTALARPVRAVLEGRSRLGLTPPEPVEGTLEEHMRVALAIADGDAEAAEACSRSHMRTVWGEVSSTAD